MKRFRTKLSLSGLVLAAAALMFLMIGMMGLATDLARMSTPQ
jgi:hypothetical protein